MRVSFTMIAAPLLGILMMSGCTTTPTSDDPVANTIYDMHRKVSRLDKDLGGTVEHLNETAADLGVRVNESNTQAREVQTMVEENQRKLEQVERKLDALTRTPRRENPTWFRDRYRSSHQRADHYPLRPVWHRNPIP